MDLSRIPRHLIDKAHEEIIGGRYFVTLYDPSRLAYRFIRKVSKRYEAKLEQTGAGHTRLVLDFYRHRKYFKRVMMAIEESDLIKKKYISEDLKDYVELGYRGFLIQVIQHILEDA